MLQGRVDLAKIDDLLQSLHRDGVFGDGRASYDCFGPDADYEEVRVRLADRDLRLRSWHELAEGKPKLVVADCGIAALDGRSRDAVLAAEPAEYRRFRRVWSEIRSAARSWVPPAGEPFVGNPRAIDDPQAFQKP